jgi:MYXO-CTERM domain-containing protein
VGDLDPTRPGLEGWAVGQSSGYDWYYYDAKTGTVLRKYGPGVKDMNRGTCGDVDPAHKGYECWTDSKVWNNSDLNTATTLSSAAPTQIGSGQPASNFRIFWDGDLLSENLDSNTVSKWAYPGAPSGGFTSANLAGMVPTRNAAPLYGDMFGDWREEVLFEQSGGTSIRIYSTAIPTEKRIYTLMHDPEYRNSMNEKGYQQSRMLDYYLGDGMTDPPRPNIKYPDGSGAAGSGGGGTTGAAGAGGGTTGAAGAAGSASTGVAGAGGGSATVLGGTTGEGGTSEVGGATGSGGTSEVGGATGSGGKSAGGASGSGGKSGTGGIPSEGGGGAGTVATGGTSESGGTPGTGGGAAGNPAPGGTTSVVGGGAGALAAGTTAAAGTSGSASSAAGGTVAGQSSTGPQNVVAGSGCSCGIGGTSGRASAGSLFAMLGVLGLVLHRRRRRLRLRD